LGWFTQQFGRLGWLPFFQRIERRRRFHAFRACSGARVARLWRRSPALEDSVPKAKTALS